MSLFVFIGFDGPEGPKRRGENRPQHLAHWDELDNAGRIQFAGPIKDDSGERSVGSVIIFEAQDLAAARGIVDKDPYVHAGVFGELRVAPIKHVYPQE